jgi:hypothetical protein
MQSRQWLAVAVIAAWALQLFNLWPLPEIESQVPASADAATRQAVAQYQSWLWIVWWVRAFAIPFGLLSGYLLLKNHRKWPVVLLITAVGSFLFFRPRGWLWLFAPLFESTERAIGRGSFLLGHPRLIFNTVVFPTVLVVAAVYAAIEVCRRRGNAHAI